VRTAFNTTAPVQHQQRQSSTLIPSRQYPAAVNARLSNNNCLYASQYAWNDRFDDDVVAISPPVRNNSVEIAAGWGSEQAQQPHSSIILSPKRALPHTMLAINAVLPPPVLQTLPERAAPFKCAICLSFADEDTLLSATNCGHVFCEECIKGAVKSAGKCPICRKSLKAKSSIHR
jgi:hypothetical protein